MTLRDPSNIPEDALSNVSLLIADELVKAGDEGVSLRDLELKVTLHAADKISSLRRHGFVIAEDRALARDGHVYVLVVDPRDRRAA